jgi:hypothetical protein
MGSLELYFVILTEESLLQDLGVTSLVNTGGLPPIIYATNFNTKTTVGAADYFILKHVTFIVACISIQWLLCQMKLAGCLPNITKRLFVFQ